MNAPTVAALDQAPARCRNVTAVLGPTNTGKTHLAIERMLGHESGLIGLPLRLLAREVYDKVAARVGPAQVALITGEEKIKPASPRFYVCTVEAMPQDLEVEFLAIDEIQVAADAERGHVFTDRLLHARGQSETLLLGAATMRDAVRSLLPGANLVSRPRLSTLSYAGQKKLSRLPRRSAVVAFSSNDVYAIAELVRRQRGGAAVVLGALSPRTRNAQVELYQNGDVDVLVATDAIGMGLNLEVGHVAFAGIRKFDGQRHRELMPAELGQIAGRAGRHMNDGTFGVTAAVEPFESELVQALEAHEFAPVKTLQWRNRALDFSSLAHLKESLRVAPQEQRLARARMVDDTLALEAVGANEDIRDMARSPAAVRQLWDVCQIPDYRKISAASHAELIAALYRYLMSDAGHIPEDWFAAQVAQADRTDGDIDTLANRIAHIRTWTFVSHCDAWLEQAAHWQERTREIEDKLSDALHDRLMHRFVDRRTSTLVKRLKDKESLFAEIGDDGSVHVERHFVGRLDGFRFSPDSKADGIHGKAARHAAAQALAGELSERAERLAAAADEAISLTRTGRLVWQDQEIAGLERGEVPLKPEIRLFADEHLSAPDRGRVLTRLQTWLERHIAETLKPLVDLSQADDVTGLARGLAFRLSETLGVLKREDVADEVKALDQDARAQLRKYGVRFGAFNIYIPLLLKPAPSDLVLYLWALHVGEAHGIDPAALPEPPRQGLTSAATEDGLSEAFYRAGGFHHCGSRVVRLDMLERLADMIRPLVAWRAGPEAGPTPEGATGNGGFKVQPDMMSIVGCSGDDFAAVLNALGFRVERKPLPRSETATDDTETPATEPAAEQPADSDEASDAAAERAEPAEEPAFEEIWRPRRKASSRDPRAKGRAPRKSKRPAAKRSKPKRASEPRKSSAGPSRRKDTVDPDSPFAALKDLKKDLENRVREQA